MFGPFPDKMIEESPVRDHYFDSNKKIKPELDSPDFKHYFVQDKLVDIILGYPIRPDASPSYMEAEKKNRALFVDLLVKMLKLDPSERISAEEALDHPFIALKFEDC